MRYVLAHALLSAYHTVCAVERTDSRWRSSSRSSVGGTACCSGSDDAAGLTRRSWTAGGGHAAAQLAVRLARPHGSTGGIAVEAAVRLVLLHNGAHDDPAKITGSRFDFASRPFVPRESSASMRKHDMLCVTIPRFAAPTWRDRSDARLTMPENVDSVKMTYSICVFSSRPFVLEQVNAGKKRSRGIPCKPIVGRR